MFLNQLQLHKHKEAFLNLAHYIASVDGIVSAKEKEYIAQYLYELDLEEGEIRIQELPLSDIIRDIDDPTVRNIIFMEIIALIFADGDYSSEEKQAVDEIKACFGVSEERYEACKDWVRRMNELYAEGVALVRPA